MSEYFKNIPQIVFEGKNSKNPFAFKYYNPDEVIGKSTMKDQLKFAMSYWHTLCGDGMDMFGKGTIDRSYQQPKDTVEHAKVKAEAGFELMQKLGIEYFCFHDADIAPAGRTLSENYKNLDIMTQVLQDKMKYTGIKCLWGTANCFSHPRYMHGAGTSPNADVFAYAAAQIKKAIDITHRLNGEGYVFWGGREGYDTLLNTDMGFELDNMARLLHMAVDYAGKIGFKGQFYIEPKPKEPTKHQYDFDAATTIAFLQKYGLEKVFKLNIEANHATLAGHTFQHELRVAAINNMLGSIDANQGDMLLGWDTDQFPTNIYDASMCMYEVIKSGGFKSGGLNFDSKQRRGSFNQNDTVIAYISGMDTFALGLRIAQNLINDGRLDDFIRTRYQSYNSGIGSKIVAGKTDFEELSEYALNMGEVSTNISACQELLESIVNNVMMLS